MTFTENGGDNEGMALTSSNAKWYSADAINNEVVCYQYAQNGKSAGTCGSVKGTPNGTAVGIAIDPRSI